MSFACPFPYLDEIVLEEFLVLVLVLVLLLPSFGFEAC